jgi:hypothetical protein
MDDGISRGEAEEYIRHKRLRDHGAARMDALDVTAILAT